MKFDPIYEPKEAWGNPRSSRVRMWIKLLVLLVILAILAWLALPVFNNVNLGPPFAQ